MAASGKIHATHAVYQTLKVNVIRECNGLATAELQISPQIFPMRTCSRLWFPKLSQQTKKISKLAMWSKILSQLMSFTCIYHNMYWYCLDWSSKRFYEISVLENLVKFTGKHLCRILFLKKAAGWKPATLSKRDSATGVFLWVWTNS